VWQTKAFGGTLTGEAASEGIVGNWGVALPEDHTKAEGGIEGPKGGDGNEQTKSRVYVLRERTFLHLSVYEMQYKPCAYVQVGDCLHVSSIIPLPTTLSP
jgi:hypothetical protein